MHLQAEQFHGRQQQQHQWQHAGWQHGGGGHQWPPPDQIPSATLSLTRSNLKAEVFRSPRAFVVQVGCLKTLQILQYPPCWRRCSSLCQGCDQFVSTVGCADSGTTKTPACVQSSCLHVLVVSSGFATQILDYALAFAPLQELRDPCAPTEGHNYHAFLSPAGLP